MSKIFLKFVNNDQHCLLRRFLIDSFLEQTFTDCIIYCNREDSMSTSEFNATSTNGYQEFRCHRLILSAYSDFFRRLFTSMYENGSIGNPHHLSSSLFLDIDAFIFDSILRLIYIGYADLPIDRKDEIQAAISKLELKEVHFDCVPIKLKPILTDNEPINYLKKRLLTSSDSVTFGKPSKHESHRNDLIADLKPIGYPQSPCSLLAQTNTSVIPNTETTVSTSTSSSTLTIVKNIVAPMPSPLSAQLSMPIIMSQTKTIGNNVGALTQSDNDVLNDLVRPASSSSSPNNVSMKESSTSSSPPPPPSQPPSTSLFSCQFCQKQYNYEISLKKHIKSSHLNAK
ncbi:BTB/POZ domain containing protein 4 [Sarcoptes scabiei]|uniref:BTB/POZ domain containing protein 4 n=1 Tax=Sarcoptes scabiei TaxID=52283 RepID=A0A132AH70_SARSC|nr:BTB/POZ domain containing protein 4 [Sarcoptes scabiei]